MSSKWTEEEKGIYIKANPDEDYFEPEPLALELRDLAPKEVPSGIQGLHLLTKDHILLFVLSNTEAYLSLIANFIAAGLHDKRYREVCTLELAPGRSREEAEQVLRRASQLADLPAMEILTYEEGASPYSSLEFAASTMQTAFHDPIHTLRCSTQFTPNHCLRIASEDASLFLRSLKNPRDYLHYEAKLARDLARSFNNIPFLQLCMYKLEDLLAEDNDGRIPLVESILTLLISHNRLVVVDDDDSIFFGKKAQRRMLRILLMRHIPVNYWFLYARVLLRSYLSFDRQSLLERMQDGT